MRKKIFTSLLLAGLISTSVPFGGLQTYATVDDNETKVESSYDDTENTVQPVNITYQSTEMSNAIYPGDEFNLGFTVSKDGTAQIEEGTAYAEITAPEGFSVSGNTNRVFLKDLKNTGKSSYSIPCEATADVAGKKGTFTITIHFNYYETVNGQKVKKAGINTYTTQVSVQKLSAPKLQFTNIKQSAVPGSKENFQLTFSLKNSSDKYSIESGTIQIEPSTGLAASDSSDTLQIGSIAPGSTTTKTLNLKTIDGLTEKESVTLTYTYTYNVGGTSLEVAGTEKLNVTTKVTAAENDMVPYVILDEYSYGSNIQYGDSFSLKVKFKNKSSDYNISNVVITATPSEGLVAKNASNKILADTLKKGKTVEKTLKFDVKDQVTSGYQNVTFTIHYQYMKDGVATDVETTETANIYVHGNPELDNSNTGEDQNASVATPYLMVESYEFGGEKVAAGSTFTLKMNIKNTSSTLGMENIIVSLNASEDLTVAAASNTFYIDKLAPGEVVTKEIDLAALSTAKSQSSIITLDSKYEFLANNSRQQVTSTEQISIPVYQQDRLDLQLVEDLEETFVGNEHNLSIQYVNKGMGNVYNVSAEIKGDVEVAEKVQNLGNFEPGANGTIDFFPISYEAGEVSGEVLITYEDENGEEKQVSVPFAYSVSEAMTDDAMMMDDSMYLMDGEYMDDSMENGTKATFNPMFIFIPAAIVIIVVIVVLVVLSKKKKKAKEQMLLDELNKFDEED